MEGSWKRISEATVYNAWVRERARARVRVRVSETESERIVIHA